MKILVQKFSRGAWFACATVLISILSITMSYADAAFQGTPGIFATANEIHLLSYIIPILEKSKKGGRLNFVATHCGENEGYLGSFPTIQLRSSDPHRVGIPAVREVLQGNTNVEVGKGSNGVIVVKVGAVPDTILHTNISSVIFTPIQQYNPSLAIPAIANTRNMRMAVARYGYHALAIPFDHLVVKPAAGLPHLPKVLTDVTADQAFDIIAQTFGGIVVYGVCPTSRLYTMSFVEPRTFSDTR